MSEKEKARSGAEPIRQPSTIGGPALPSLRGPSKIRMGMHAASQVVGSKTRARQLAITFPESAELYAEEYSSGGLLDLAGFDLDDLELEILMAVIRKLDEIGYKPGSSARKQERRYANGQLSYVTLPSIPMTRRELAEACGLQKGKSGHYPRAAMDAREAALQRLLTKTGKVYYKRKYRDKKGQYRYDTVMEESVAITRLRKLYKGLTAEEERLLEEEGKEPKKRALGWLITPAPVLIDQIESYFILLDRDLLERIKALGGELGLKTRAVSAFSRRMTYLIIWLNKLSRLGATDKAILASTLATILRESRLVEQRRQSEMLELGRQILEAAQELGYLKGWRETLSQDDKPMFIVYLAPEMLTPPSSRKQIVPIYDAKK